MELEYEVRNSYELSYVSTIIKDGSPYLVVTDGKRDFTVKPYDYQVEYSSIPSTIRCFVWKLSINGTPYFEQVKEDVLKNCYYQSDSSSDILHTFVVKEVRIDNHTNKPFYLLSDEYGIVHRYYPKEAEIVKKQGDELNLVVKGIIPAKRGKNNARLDLDLPEAGTRPVFTVAPDYPKDSGRKSFGCEDEKKEFKTSIVYPAGETAPDIDRQLGVICRSIAGFMNAKGGTIYIGVTDSGYICGIESDYKHLNDGEDKYSYKENDDCYLQKITNRVCLLLGRLAGTLINMRIETEADKKYCVIEIQKASRPIWFRDSSLFVRIVTTNRRLERDEITQFVLDRVTKSSFREQIKSEKPVVDNTLDEPDSSDAEIPVVAPVPVPTVVKTKKSNKAWRHMTFYKDGYWSFQKDELQGDDVVCSVVIPSDARQKNHILILAYENGHVEAVALKMMLYGKNGLLPEGARRGKGLYMANGRVVAALCVNKKDMLLLTSKLSEDVYVMAFDVETLGIHDKSGMGNKIVREAGSTLVKAIHVPNDDGVRISLKGSGIFIEKKYTKGGVKLTLLAPQYRQLIDSLETANAD